MPFPSSEIIPPNWEEHHRPVVAGAATAACRVIRPAAGPAPYGGAGEAPPTIWEGTCRLQQHNVMAAPVQGGQPLEVRQYLVVFPWLDDNPLPTLLTGERGDIVEVRGSRYRLRQGLNGSLLWEHDFIAQEIQTQEREP